MLSCLKSPHHVKCSAARYFIVSMVHGTSNIKYNLISDICYGMTLPSLILLGTSKGQKDKIRTETPRKLSKPLITDVATC